MPNKFETSQLLIQPEHDKRRKLTEEQKHEICSLYETGLYSQRQLAAMFKVSRRLVVYTIYPERIIRPDSSKYYDKDKHREYVKEYRKHKKELYVKGLLVEKEKSVC